MSFYLPRPGGGTFKITDQDWPLNKYGQPMGLVDLYAGKPATRTRAVLPTHLEVGDRVSFVRPRAVPSHPFRNKHTQRWNRSWRRRKVRDRHPLRHTYRIGRVVEASSITLGRAP